MFPLTYNALHSMQVQDALGESARDLALQQSNKAGSDQVSAAAICRGHTQTHMHTHTQRDAGMIPTLCMSLEKQAKLILENKGKHEDKEGFLGLKPDPQG